MNELMRKFLSEVAVFNLEPAETICFSLYCDGSMNVQLTEKGFCRCMVGRRLSERSDEYTNHITFRAGSLEFVAITETDEMKEFIVRELKRQSEEVAC